MPTSCEPVGNGLVTEVALAAMDGGSDGQLHGSFGH